MNKKYLPLIIVGVVVLIIILLNIGGPEIKDLGSELTATTTCIDNNSEVTISDVNVYVDNSGSMKGYSEFAGYPTASRVFVSNTDKLLANIASDYNPSFSIKCGNYQTTDRNDFRTRLSNGSIFSGAITELDKMITTCINNSNDSKISILLSDMVLSYGKTKLNSTKDPDYNQHHLSDLGGTIYSALKGANQNLLILQYYSEFNGNYYYNYTENIKSGTQYRNNLLNKRPYYIVVFGSEEALKSLLANKVFPKYENIYASFGLKNSDYTTDEFKIKLNETSNWMLGEEPGKIGTIWTQSDLLNDKEKFIVSIDRFEIPAFVEKQYTIDFEDSSVIYDVEDLTAPGDKKLSFEVTLKPFSNLPEKAEAEFKLVSSFDWASNASIEDDANINDLSDLEGKTWGFSEIIKNINDAYFKDGRKPDILAEFKFGIAIIK